MININQKTVNHRRYFHHPCAGIVSYSLLNLNLLPKIELPTLTIVTVYLGAGASEVKTGVTKKIEDALRDFLKTGAMSAGYIYAGKYNLREVPVKQRALFLSRGRRRYAVR
jgi:hypothetical protein